MDAHKTQVQALFNYLAVFCLLAVQAFWIKHLDAGSCWQDAGFTTFLLGFLLLTSYMAAKVLVMAGLPLISGYIFMGIIAGPDVSGFLTEAMVLRLRLVDDLALSFIALTAGGTLRMDFLRKRRKAILVSMFFQTVLTFLMIFSAVMMVHTRLGLSTVITPDQTLVMACLLGVIAVARSPSSAIAIITESQAKGPFTSTVLGVTIAMDVLIIVLFTLAMTVCKTIPASGSAMDYQTVLVLCLTVAGSLGLGALLGKGISLYIRKIGHDLTLVLLFFAFGVFKVSEWFNHFMEFYYSISLYLEPLLICISAGFVARNFSRTGHQFMESLERLALPIYVIFFSLAGASLDLDALWMTWPMALILVIVRVAGIFSGSWFAGVVNKDRPLLRRIEWMAYLTQAGVSIGLAKLAQTQFPELGGTLTTLVLAVITINQIVGPVTFKFALNMAGESRRD